MLFWRRLVYDGQLTHSYRQLNCQMSNNIIPYRPSHFYFIVCFRTMHMEGFLFLVGAAVLATVSGQFLPQYIQPPSAQQALTYNQPISQPLIAAPSQQSLAHRDVLINSQQEAQLPPHLLNPFYKNPRVAQALAKESWFGPGEMLVNERETQKIPRTNIFSMLKNAGLARRRR